MEVTEKLVRKVIDERIRFPFPYSVSDWCKHLYLENYHCHKDTANFRVKDCVEPIENYVTVIKERDTKCLFSGDHGSQGNAFPVYTLAEQNGLKYRHSAEAYWVRDRHEQDRSNCHIMIVAKNDEGRQDLNYILSVANEDGFYGQPRIDLELLLSVKPENFIVTSACLAFWSKYEDIDDIAKKIADHFGDNFFFEIQCHLTDRQKECNRHILALAKKWNVQLICGLDTHYISEESRLKRLNLMKYKDSENDEEQGWFMDYPTVPEIISRLEEQGVLSDEEILEAILNTNVFVNECEEIVLDRHFKIPNIFPDKTYEERVQWFKQHINELYKEEELKSKEKVQGIRWEVEQFAESGTIDYPIVSEAIVKKAVDSFSGEITKTGRGSAPSFFTNRLIGLTTIDRFNSDIPLFAERFLTKERVLANSMPDVDLNISSQEPFVTAARTLLGEHSCYPLMALSKLKEKAAWQMYASVNGVTPEQANIVSKYIDQYSKAKMNADDEEKDDIHSEDFIPKEYQEIYKKSCPYQGITIGNLAHPCGFLIYQGDIRREIGLMSAVSETTRERTLVVACEGSYLDAFGYVKEDFLIVDSVALIYKLYRSIGMEVPSFEELKELVHKDSKTWEIYDKGITCCVNQCEGEGTKHKAMKYKPKNIAELSAFIAAVRPGFKSLINVFLDRKPYTTGEPAIDELLADSSHFMLYQESVMKILSFLGIEMGETYGVIKSISKKRLKGEKKANLLKELKAKWLEKIGNLDNFNKVWQIIEDSARYSFNACVSGDTKLMRQGESKTRWHPTVEEMYNAMNDPQYANEAGHNSLRGKYRRLGYGNALSMDDDGRIRSNAIMDITVSGIKPIYRVVMENGSSIDCTMDHSFPVPEGGKKELRELSVGDELFVKGKCEKTSKKYRFTNGTFRKNHPKKGQMGFQNKRHYDMGRTKCYEKGIPTEISKIQSIEYLKTDMTYNIEMADPSHNFLTESGLVASNSHAYSMTGDSLYIAYFKANYPYEFYEVAINHYQEKNKKKKINALVEEARKFYGLKLGQWKFGVDNTKVTIDREKKIIYPALSSIKGIGDKVAAEIFEVSKTAENVSSFTEIMMKLKEETSMNKAVREKLIMIDYFLKFGDPKELLRQADIFELFASKKTVKDSNLETYGLSLEDVAIVCDKTTSKQGKYSDPIKMVNYIIGHTKKEKATIIDRMKYQFNVLEQVSVVDTHAPDGLFIATVIEGRGKKKRITLYNPKIGKSRQVYTWESSLKGLKAGDCIRVKSLKQDFKRLPVEEDGKQVWKKTSEKEYWLKVWSKC